MDPNEVSRRLGVPLSAAARVAWNKATDPPWRGWDCRQCQARCSASGRGDEAERLCEKCREVFNQGVGVGRVIESEFVGFQRGENGTTVTANPDDWRRHCVEPKQRDDSHYDVVELEGGADAGTWHVCIYCENCWRPNAAPEHYEDCPVGEALGLRDAIERCKALAVDLSTEIQQLKTDLRLARMAAETTMQACWIWEGNEDLSTFSEEAVVVMYAGQLRSMLPRDPRQEAYDQMQSLAKEVEP